MDNNDGNFEIIDPENYTGGNKGESFSNSQLIMMALTKCLNNGSVEMREGYFNRKKDKMGNVMEIYVPDTRLTFIETVESTLMIMSDDIYDVKGKETEEVIKKILEELKEKEKTYLELEKKEWSTPNFNLKQKWFKEGKRYIPGVLTQFFPYYDYYIMDKVQAYRKIVIELKKLTKKYNYYAEEFYEA